jgi:uncharacterized protein (DUF849 family)
MIVQACLNGLREPSFYPALPLTPDAMARDGAACVAAGAAELHLHARGPDGRESLAPAAMDATVLAMRRACPGTLVGVSTGAWMRATSAIPWPASTAGASCRTMRLSTLRSRTRLQ